MFEITPDDISQLSDEDLRALVGRLCESEAKSRQFPTSAVTWGGNQNAADGGIDVRVALPNGAVIDGFVPRPQTGFQVKSSDMPHTEILKEMQVHGAIRPAICELANRSGAYVMVSSRGSTSDLSLENRRAAMREAVGELPNASALTLDFYDRTRLATWLRDHIGLIPWVREKVGKPIRGWRSYDAWAYAPEGVRAEYLVDDKSRVRAGEIEAEISLTILEGIKRLRERLHESRKVVRLVGLSGVGKTRLVQALFDDRYGEDSLDPSLAFYTNMSDGPDPQPVGLISDLINARTRAILVVDNCPPDLHARLTELCRCSESLVSLITVEYDIRDDQPEGTDVFSLEPSSIDLIEKLVGNRFPQISQIDARTVAESSDGNARIALALAGTIGRNESIASISDQELFKRLFQQRNEPNESLLTAAQALSLVYSYEGEDVSTDNRAELFTLGALVGKSPQEMFRSSAELQRRDLVQQRAEWRAVLPHAIANRLAATALENIPSTEIKARLIQDGPERMQKSFSRRLSYLAGSKEAEAIASNWLSPVGPLKNVADLDDLDCQIFHNLAAVVPEAALASLEAAVLGAKEPGTVARCRRYTHVLRSTAYSAGLFERCVAVILKIAEAQDTEDGVNDLSKTFSSLFPILFSGTHATIDQRLAVIEPLLRSHDAKIRSLGLAAIGSALEAWHFGPGYGFEFGARSRDYGYRPLNGDDVKQWFGKTLRLVESLGCSNEPLAAQIRKLFQEKFRGLWSHAAVYDDLERVVRAFYNDRFWTEGWIVVRETIYYDSKNLNPEGSAWLATLERFLRPDDLVQRVRSIVLSDSLLYIGFDSEFDEGENIQSNAIQMEAAARELGKAVAADQNAFAALLPELVTSNSQQLWVFGGGLSEGSPDPHKIWTQLVAELAAAPVDEGNPQVFRGFLKTLTATDPNLVNALLDDALENEPLSRWYPVLQTAVGIDKKGVQRLMRSLDIGKAGIGIYGHLMSGGVTHQICGSDFNRLLLRIAQTAGGPYIATEILFMRLFSDEGRRQSSASEIVDIGCDLMRLISFPNRRDVGFDHKLRTIAGYCLLGEKGAATVREICRNLKDAVSKSETSGYYQQELLQVLFRAQPLAALEVLCGETEEDLKGGMRILHDASELRRNAFDAIQETDLLTWCDRRPEIRFVAVAGSVTAFQPSSGAEHHQWTSTALKLLDRAPNRVEVLKKFIRQFSPMTWAGSRTATVESNSKLLDELLDYPDPAVREFVVQEKIRISEAIKAERNMETRIDRERDQRFE